MDIAYILAFCFAFLLYLVASYLLYLIGSKLIRRLIPNVRKLFAVPPRVDRQQQNNSQRLHMSQMYKQKGSPS
jgi:hypothetical protein